MTTALLITADDLLLDDVLRLAAAAGTTLDVAPDAGSALRGWPGAAAVLVGADQAEALARHRPLHRDQVHVVTRAPLPDDGFRSALAVGARAVLELPAADDLVVELLSDLGDGSPGHTVGVVAGSGGAGATTLACALATVAAADRATVLLDLDPLGPGVDRVVGLDTETRPDGEPPLRWDELVAASGRLSSRALREALPRHGPLAVLGWGPQEHGVVDPVAVREVLCAAQRGHDLVVADLPRAFDDVTVEVLTRCDRVLLVVEAGVPGVVAASRLAGRLAELSPAVAVVLRHRAAGVPADQVAATLDLPVVAEVGRQRRLAEDVDLGLGPVRSRRSPLARAAGDLLQLLPPVR